MRQMLATVLNLLTGLLLSQLVFAGGIEPTPETDLGYVAVSISSSDPLFAWVASAHEDHIRDILSQSPRLRTIGVDTLKLGECEDFACRRQRLNAARIDLYLEGELDGEELELRAIVPETEIELSQQTISVKAGKSPESVKSAILHAMKSFTEAGGILDQRSALRRAQKEAAEQELPAEAKRNLAIGLASVAVSVLFLIILALIVFPSGRRPLFGLGILWLVFALGPLWLISEDLALVKPLAIFALPEPWVLAVLGGLGTGSALWALALCILPQLRGLEFMKQERMPFLLSAIAIIIAYRLLAFAIGSALAAGIIIAAQMTFGLDAVQTVAVGLVTLGGLTTLGALIFEVLAQRLDRRYVTGEASADNSSHMRVMEGLRAHPRLAGLRDILDRSLVLPTSHDQPLSYGGGFLSSPRILIPRHALEKAFETSPEEEGAPFDFLVGLVINGLGKISIRSHLDSTLQLSFTKTLKRYRKPSHRRVQETTFFSPYTAARHQLEGAFLAVHEGLAPFIQYLYWRHKPHTGILTVRATRTQLSEAVKTIFEEISSGRFPLTIERPRDHIIYLVETYLRHGRPPTAEPKGSGRKMRPLKVSIIVITSLFLAYQVLSAAIYHPVYVERIALQQAKIDAKKMKKEDSANVPEPQPETPNDAIVVTQPQTSAPGTGSQELVEKVAPAKPKPRPKSKAKSKQKQKQKLKPKKEKRGQSKRAGKSKPQERGKKPLPAAKKQRAPGSKL